MSAVVALPVGSVAEEGKIVAFTGRLEVGVRDILQFLGLSKKTGKLTLSRLEGTGEILFKNGKIIHTAAVGTQNTLGQILVSRNFLSKDDLMVGLDLQHNTLERKRLGAILVEQGFITHAVLGEAIRHQIKDAIFEFLTWETGFFRFELMEIDAGDEIMVDAKDLLGETGMAPEHVRLERLRRFDEQRETEKSPPRTDGVRFRYNFLYSS